MVNSFTGAVYFRKWDDGLVEVQVYAYNASGSSSYSDKIICTLPVGYRPSLIARGAFHTSRLGFSVDGYIYDSGAIHTQTVGAYYHFARFAYRV